MRVEMVSKTRTQRISDHQGANTPAVALPIPGEGHSKGQSERRGMLPAIGIFIAFSASLFLGVGYFFTYGYLDYFGVSRDIFVRSNEIYVFRAFDAAYIALKVLIDTDSAFWMTALMTVLPSVAIAVIGLLMVTYVPRIPAVKRWIEARKSKSKSKNASPFGSILVLLLGTITVPIAIAYALVLIVFAYLIPGLLGQHAAQTDAQAFLLAGGCEPKDTKTIHLHPCIEILNEKTGIKVGKGLLIAASDKTLAFLDPIKSTTVTLMMSDAIRVERQMLNDLPAKRRVRVDATTTTKP